MKKVFLIVVLCLVVAVVAVPYPSYGKGGGHGGGRSGGGFHGGGGGRWYGGYSRGGHYYGGRYYGGYGRYYYRGHAPSGAVFGAFLGGIVIGGISSPFWWPYYAVPVPPAYYDPYYQYPYPAPPYVIEVPPAEATTAYPQGPQVIEVPSEGATYPLGPPPAATPPNQCYAPKTDAKGNIIKDNGNMIPDFSKPVPCPPEQ